MYQENDDMLEVNDFDEDIRRREELIEEAKNIPADADWNEVMHQVNDLRRRWRRIQYWDSAYEETLAEEFDSYIDAFYAKRREFYQSAQKLKEELIEQARKVALSEEWNQATEEMNALMQQWRQPAAQARKPMMRCGNSSTLPVSSSSTASMNTGSSCRENLKMPVR